MRVKHLIILLLAGAALLSLGVVLDEFWLAIATEALILSLLTISFSLLYGYTGLLSFGQGAYYAVGAYGFALAMTKLSLPFPVCVVIGLAAAVAWAWITGFVCVRLAGIYFAIMTVVVAQSTFYVIFQWYRVTGGDNGIQGLLPPEIIRGPRSYYLFTLAAVSLAYYLYYRLVNSPFGLSLKCMRENSVRSTFVGIVVRRHMHKAFVAAGFFAGLSGVLFAPFSRSVVPQMADWLSSGKAVFMGVLGGAGNLWGPVIGAAIWTGLDAFVTGVTEYWPMIIGSILFLIVFFMPGGFMGLLEKACKKRG